MLSTAAFAQKDNEMEFYDISGKLNESKIFSIDSDNLINIGKSGYNIDYIMELFYASMSDNDTELKINPKVKRIVSKVLKKNKYLKYRRKVLQNIIIEDENINTVYVLGKNTHNPNRLITYFIINSEKYSGCVYKSISSNQGKTWQSPTIAIKHNNIPLRGWDIIDFKSNSKTYGLSAILTDSVDNVYISSSTDLGYEWSYPQKLNYSFKGTKFHTSTYKKTIAVIFETSDIETTNKGVFLLLSNMSELENSKINNIAIKVSDKIIDNVNWKLNHINQNDIFLIKTTYQESQTIIDGYLISVKKITK